MKKIPVTARGGKIVAYALVDDEDHPYLKGFRWHRRWNRDKFYVQTSIWDKVKDVCLNIALHNAILWKPKGYVIDHINGNNSDNRRSNLRICTPAENARNTRRYNRNTSGYKGVSLVKGIKEETWKSEITLDNKRIYLGVFKNKLDAAKAYDEAAVKYHREYARTNFKKKTDGKSN